MDPGDGCEAEEDREKSVETSAEQREERETIQKERRKKREEWTATFVTPGLRPLAEPPILSIDDVVNGPSDIRYKALFPNDPGKRSRIKDIAGERDAMLEYLTWAFHLRDEPNGEDPRRQFYGNLANELMKDVDESRLDEEYDELASATLLGQFEFRYLDNDGSTATLEANMKRGVEYFKRRFVGDWGAEVRGKYGHLVPKGFVEDPLARFEHEWLDEDDGGTVMLCFNLEEGNNVLAAYPEEEVQKKYGHLRSFLEKGKWEEQHRSNWKQDD